MTSANSGLRAAIFCAMTLGWLTQLAIGQDAGIEKQLEKAVTEATRTSQPVKKYQLQYRLNEGELIRSRVVHLVSMDTKIDGEFENLKSRSVSTRVFQVNEVDAEGNITLVHRVEDADLWQKVTGQNEVRYNSKTDEVVPENYERLAASIGKPLAVITVSPSGAIVARKDEVTQRRLLLVELRSALVQLFVSLRNAAVEGIKKMPHCTIFALGPVASRITIRGQVIISRDQGGDPPP